jgi:NTP pyrophosphatase (non-canonical NTP hydrolase)
MDKETNLEELKEYVKDFCKERDWDKGHTPKDMAIQMITEAAELLEHFRFYNEDEVNEKMKSEARNDIEEELADIFYGVLRFAQLYDIDLSDTFYKKMKKTADKYPAKK